ncbi:MAG: C25 family cysteine peptidase [Flavobacteriales bacterium]|nr:C25 family cysteine peptidase [Flavobacteriales bacterium]
MGVSPDNLKSLCVHILIFAFCSGFFFHRTSAQSYGNEWIVPDQVYFKCPVFNQGIHKISYSTLQGAGFPLNTDPRQVQMVARGQEIPVFIAGEADGVWDPGDYILFFGEPNDGRLDTLLFMDPKDHATPALSLFCDTIYYFLTVSGNLSNLRFIPETDNNFQAYDVAPFYWALVRQTFSSEYNPGQVLTHNILNPAYTAGEGWAAIFNGAQFYTQGWSGVWAGYQSTLFTAGPNAEFRIHIAGANDPPDAAPLDHRYFVTFGSGQKDTSISAYGLAKMVVTSTGAGLASAAFAYRVHFSPFYSMNTRNALLHAEARMPQVYNLSGRQDQYMEIPDNPAQSKYHLSISNFNTNGSVPWLFDLTGRRMVTVYSSGSGFSVLLPNGPAGLNRCFLTSESRFIEVTTLRPVQVKGFATGRFRNFAAEYRNFNYLTITSKALWNEAEQYTDYRRLTGWKAITLDFEELTDQFAWGIPGHPQAVRNFLRFALDSWTTKPELVFLIGKGYSPPTVRWSPAYWAMNYVPTLGNPATDNLYGFNLYGTKKFHVGIGRLTARNPGEVLNYLKKVMNNEAQKFEPWMKRALHFAGGFSQQEQQALLNYLNGYKAIYEDTLMGGRVYTFSKSSNAPVSITLADSIKGLINGGVALMTFFGHASGSGFDTNIDDPAVYENQGKCPVVLANSCFSGDLFQDYYTVSERFVHEPYKGAVAFIASSTVNLTAFIAQYGYEFYKNICWRRYLKPLGTAVSFAGEALYHQSPNPFGRALALEMGLHGDPALTTYGLPKPDLVITPPYIRAIPQVVTTDQDSFLLQVAVFNAGRAMTDSLDVEVRRKYAKPGKPDDIILKRIPPVLFSDTFFVKLPTDPIHGPGINYITATADPADAVDEMANNNNSATIPLFIGASEIFPVYPPRFAVIPNNTTWLKASTGDPFAPVKKYKFQLDTTDLFNTPFLRDTVIQQSGGVVKWKPPVLFQDSTVYFWRVGVDSANTGVFHKWRESSFEYIQGKYGWGQSHFYQFKDNDYLYTVYNRPFRRFDFSPNLKQLKVVTIGQPGGLAALNYCKYDLDGVLQEYGTGCGFVPLLAVAVIDPTTLEPWGSRCNGLNPNNGFGNLNDNCACRNRVEKLFYFRPDVTPSREALKDMLNNSVPLGYYVLVFTLNSTNFQYFSGAQLQAFLNLGADTIVHLAANATNVPYIFFARKGFPATAQEVVGSGPNDMITLTTVLQNDWKFGRIQSPLIGASTSWKSFHWRTRSVEQPTQDSISMTVFGISGAGNSTPLLTIVNPAQVDIPDLFNYANAAQYPYLRLSFFTRDDSLYTPSQLRSWRILFDGVPECALNPALGYTFQDDTLPQGTTLRLAVPVENIGDYPMDSLAMKYFIVDPSNVSHTYLKTLGPLPVGAVLTDTFKVSNMSYPDLNVLWMEANPFDHPKRQPEQYHFNNIASRTFLTLKDKINPLLDVTFDGVRIMNGDIVSGRPEIHIYLKDENKLLWLNDTSLFEIFLKKPTDNAPKKLSFSQPDLTFYPATSAQNQARVEYRPDFTDLDGVYRLSVRARDRSQNASGMGNGDFDYNVEFRVVNKSTITEVLNYPNPFSTSTRFVFTLTGNRIPTFMKIQILTTDGRIVREIFQDELGPIRIGRNITEFAWDGTDQFGDKLASGVYLYRVITEMEGEQIEKSSTAADRFFRKGWGKMYLMR